MKDFGFSGLDLTEQDFLESEQVIQLGIAPLRIDIITSIKGMDFQKLWEDREVGRYGNIEVNFISKKDLIRYLLIRFMATAQPYATANTRPTAKAIAACRNVVGLNTMRSIQKSVKIVLSNNPR